MLRNEKYVPSSRRGVLHMSPVPRNMRPSEIQSHFNRFGEIRRMKFVPYPKKERWPGGPLLPLRYREGWMEFTDADAARRAADTLNGQAVDVKRLRKCHGELWVVKFLGNDFSWDSLVEEKEEKRRLRRSTQVQARQKEKEANEAYRRLVMSSLSRRSKQKKERADETRDNTDTTENDVERDAATSDKSTSLSHNLTTHGTAAATKKKRAPRTAPTSPSRTSTSTRGMKRDREVEADSPMKRVRSEVSKGKKKTS